jgi:hypothetical protein
MYPQTDLNIIFSITVEELNTINSKNVVLTGIPNLVNSKRAIGGST